MSRYTHVVTLPRVNRDLSDQHGLWLLRYSMTPVIWRHDARLRAIRCVSERNDIHLHDLPPHSAKGHIAVGTKVSSVFRAKMAHHLEQEQ